VWDNNHQIQAWMPYISRVHPNDLFWHILVDPIVLNMRKGVATLALGSLQRQGLVGVRAKREAHESHLMLLGVQKSVRE
jgi:hypothetical protein